MSVYNTVGIERMWRYTSKAKTSARSAFIRKNNGQIECYLAAFKPNFVIDSILNQTLSWRFNKQFNFLMTRFLEYFAMSIGEVEA